PVQRRRGVRAARPARGGGPVAASSGRDRIARVSAVRAGPKPGQHPQRSGFHRVHAGLEGAVGALSRDAVTPPLTASARRLIVEAEVETMQACPRPLSIACAALTTAVVELSSQAP